MKKILSFFLTIVLILSFGSMISLIVGIKKPDKKDDSLSENPIVLGVSGIGGTTINLQRTDDSVGLNYFSEDYNELGSRIVSDFDDFYPYSDITKVSDPNGNVFVKIPKFYSRLSQNLDGTTKLQICKEPLDGFSTLFIDGNGNELDYILVGAYESSGSSSQLFSKSGNFKPAVSLSLEECRQASCINGTNYQQFDYLTLSIINQLFTVEFAVMDSQLVFRGNVDRKTITNCGSTDILPFDSGFLTTGEFKYRGIENYFGNSWTLVDGILYNELEVWVSFNPSSYTSVLYDSDYIRLPFDRASKGGVYFSLKLFDENSSFFFPCYDQVFSNSRGFGDYNVQCNTVDGQVVYGEVIAFGGTSNYGDRAGIWCMYGDIVASYKNNYYGSRLVYKPINNFIEI